MSASTLKCLGVSLKFGIRIASKAAVRSRRRRVGHMTPANVFPRTCYLGEVFNVFPRLTPVSSFPALFMLGLCFVCVCLLVSCTSRVLRWLKQ